MDWTQCSSEVVIVWNRHPSNSKSLNKVSSLENGTVEQVFLGCDSFIWVSVRVPYAQPLHITSSQVFGSAIVEAY